MQIYDIYLHFLSLFYLKSNQYFHQRYRLYYRRYILQNKSYLAHNYIASKIDHLGALQISSVSNKLQKNELVNEILN